jgi:hypothetical protein
MGSDGNSVLVAGCVFFWTGSIFLQDVPGDGMRSRICGLCIKCGDRTTGCSGLGIGHEAYDCDNTAILAIQNKAGLIPELWQAMRQKKCSDSKDHPVEPQHRLLSVAWKADCVTASFMYEWTEMNR